MIRSAKAAARSFEVCPFSNSSACGACVDCSRRAQESSVSGRVEHLLERQPQIALVDHVQRAAVVLAICRASPPNTAGASALSTRSGSIGAMKLGPPAFRFSRPATASMASRSLLRFQPAMAELPQQRVLGVLLHRDLLDRRDAATAGTRSTAESCDVSGLIFHPPSTNRLASQSSSSGFEGRVPMRPKSLGVETMPAPK